MTLDGPKTAGGLTFGDPTGGRDWFVRTGTGGALTLDAGASVPLVNVVNRTATLGANLTGIKGFAKSGSGTLVLSGVNTYTGPTKILTGTLRLSAPPRFPTGMKIMPLGDSITYGYNGSNAGYRGPLYYLLNPLAPDFRYIGTTQVRPGLLPPGPIDERSHEGHSSYNLLDVFNNLDGFDNTRFLLHGGPERNPNGGYWLTGGNGTGRPPAQPDAITMMLGTNDLENQPGVETRLRNLIGKISTLRPDTTLIVAQITPAHVPPPPPVPNPITLAPLHASVIPYNAMVASVVAEFRAAGKKVNLVDMCSQFPPTGLIPDGAHPNDTGFDWMALQWYEALISAYTLPGGQSPSLPAGTDVTISTGASLDLDGYQGTVATLENSGLLDMGSNGALSATTVRVQKNALVAGSGTIDGNVIHNSPALGAAGETLTFIGNFTNNGTLGNGLGADLVFNGSVINNGTLSIGPGDHLTFSGSLTNNGVIRLTGNTELETGGFIVNNGILDTITGPQALPFNFVNHGLVLDAGDVTLHSSSMTAQTATLTILSYNGHTYQLQRSTTLHDGSWENVGESQSGKTGVMLEFQASRDAAARKSFYRIAVDP
ncbi:MAG: hypothetical protein EOP87_07560 [Verrucomicrobiaceae bacterium]|nr:MAG: hypothetical protein EOP87_07560 [Verrucomicrobiaceae bacterium]